MASDDISIFLLVRSLEAGGAERQLVELARELHRRGFKVTVATFYKRGPLLCDLEKAGVPLVDLGKGGRWDLAGFLVRTALSIRESRPAIVYSFLGGANIVASAVRWFVPPAKLVWSIRASNMDLGRYDWLHGVAYWVECRLSRTADLIISNSHAGRDFAVKHGFPADRIHIVPNGVDTDRFKPDADLRQRQRAAWGLSDEHIAVGVLARLDPMKGHGVFLKAAAKIVRQRSRLRIFVVGAGPEEDRLKRQAARLGLERTMRFTGPSETPEAALNALDICCSPSEFGEGFSNSIAEAMACGVPCVVTDVGDSARIVGDAGEVVPPSDSRALGEAILRLADRLDDDCKQRARDRAADHFSVGAMVDGTLAVFKLGD